MPNSSETMGAIRVKVKLTNAIDEGMVSRGVLAPRHLRQVEGEALVDTGALTLVIPPAIAQALGLNIRGRQIARFANGAEQAVEISEPVMIECEGRSATVQALIVGDEILIGQVVLELMDFLADCKNQRLIPAHPDYPIAMIK
jgi:clan AA aspartic protease